MDLPGQHRGGASCRLTLSHGAASLTPTQKTLGKYEVFQGNVHSLMLKKCYFSTQSQ